MLSPTADCPDECLMKMPYIYNTLTNEGFTFDEFYEYESDLEHFIEEMEEGEISIDHEAWIRLIEYNSSMIKCDDICGSCDASENQEIQGLQ